MNIKIEIWNGYEIRFVEKEPGDWWAVAKDVSDALGYRMASDMTRNLDDDEKGTHKVRTTSDKVKCPATQDMTIISEFGIYEAAWGSHKQEAKDFKCWVKNVIRVLRQASGLEGFQIFRMLDKDHQKETMKQLHDGLKKPRKLDYIKANNIANKAVSTRHGYRKMVKKEEMTPQMLIERQPILDDTVKLMAISDEFGLDFSVAGKIYAKYN